VKTSADVAAAAGLPTIGVIPSFKTEAKAKGPIAEIARIANIIRGSDKEKRKKIRAERNDGNVDDPTMNKPLNGLIDRSQQENASELIALRKPHSYRRKLSFDSTTLHLLPESSRRYS
jgi:hypothetical protein